MHEAFDAVANLDERTELDELRDSSVDKLTDLVGLGELLPRVGLSGLQREADPLAAEVYIEHLDLDRVANGNYRTWVIDMLPRQLADVDQAVHTAEVDERTERHNRRHVALADLADLEVGEEAVASLLLSLLEEGTTAQHDIVAVLVEFDDLGLDNGPNVWLQVADTAQLDERRGEEATQTDVDDQAALDDFDDRTRHDLVGFLLGLYRSPGSLVLSTLLGEDQTAFLVFLCEDERLDLLTERHNFRRVDIVTDAQLTSRNNTLTLVTNVEQNFVFVNLDDGADDDLTVFDFHNGVGDRISEAHAEVVDRDLSRGVVTVLIEGSHGGIRVGQESRGIGQRTNYFQSNIGGCSRSTGFSAGGDPSSVETVPTSLARVPNSNKCASEPPLVPKRICCDSAPGKLSLQPLAAAQVEPQATLTSRGTFNSAAPRIRSITSGPTTSRSSSGTSTITSSWT